MRLHAKRLVIGIWSTTAVAFVLVVLFSREGQEGQVPKFRIEGNVVRGKAHNEEKPQSAQHLRKSEDDEDAPDSKIFQEVLDRLQAMTDRVTKSVLITQKSSKSPIVKVMKEHFHGAIHGDVHKQKHDHVGANITTKIFSKSELDELMSKHAHLLHITEDEKVYSHIDHKMNRLFPLEDEQHDRIVSQMKFIPKMENGATERKLRKILVFNGLPADTKPGKSRFKKDKCKVQECELTTDISEARSADMILFQNTISMPYRGPKLLNQTWVLFFLESPKHTMGLTEFRGLVNLTASYKRDSHIVTPYEKFVPHLRVDKLPDKPKKNYAAGKPKKVAWFVSNCGTSNGRLSYAIELQKYIHVDIYGACGTLHCFRTKADQCFKMLSSEYKFYLSFENSNCKDYITEKLYWNALKNEIIPVVMGARRSEYEAVAPPHSFIHVDDFDGPEDLANFLHLLDQNDDLYNSFFLWKDTGEFINTYFWCRLCTMAHVTPHNPHWVDDLEKWWRGEDQCVALRGAQRWSSWVT